MPKHIIPVSLKPPPQVIDDEGETEDFILPSMALLPPMDTIKPKKSKDPFSLSTNYKFSKSSRIKRNREFDISKDLRSAQKNQKEWHIAQITKGDSFLSSMVENKSKNSSDDEEEEKDPEHDHTDFEIQSVTQGDETDLLTTDDVLSSDEEDERVATQYQLSKRRQKNLDKRMRFEGEIVQKTDSKEKNSKTTTKSNSSDSDEALEPFNMDEDFEQGYLTEGGEYRYYEQEDKSRSKYLEAAGLINNHDSSDSDLDDTGGTDSFFVQSLEKFERGFQKKPSN